MPIIKNITAVLITYQSQRPFPGSDESHLDGYLKSISRLEIANDILIIEMLDRGVSPKIVPSMLPDSRFRVIPRINEPPHPDPVHQEVYEYAENDWVFFLDDDERMSEGMIRLINSLNEQDPAPQHDWAAMQFRREDYIVYQDVWRYIPANGQDQQIRLTDRQRSFWTSNPHGQTVLDGPLIYINRQDVAILHYRSYEKIVQATNYRNEIFSNLPNIVTMQTEYVKRVESMLGINNER